MHVKSFQSMRSAQANLFYLSIKKGLQIDQSTLTVSSKVSWIFCNSQRLYHHTKGLKGCSWFHALPHVASSHIMKNKDIQATGVDMLKAFQFLKNQRTVPFQLIHRKSQTLASHQELRACPRLQNCKDQRAAGLCPQITIAWESKTWP